MRTAYGCFELAIFAVKIYTILVLRHRMQVTSVLLAITPQVAIMLERKIICMKWLTTVTSLILSTEFESFLR